MGGGASKGKDKDQPVEQQADAAHGAPALQRRRRVLLGAKPGEQLEFESVPPKDQYVANIPEDVVFSRYGNLEAINEFRRRAEVVQYHNNDGYLDENAIELLDLGLESGSSLAKRLFQVAQVQRVEGVESRRNLMTCYELCALYSVLRVGQDADLLELMYCLFDVDGDDRLSAGDLTVGIDAFLSMREAAEFLENQDRQDFQQLDDRARRAEAKRLADAAVAKYGGTGRGEAGGDEPAQGVPSGGSSPGPEDCAEVDGSRPRGGAAGAFADDSSAAQPTIQEEEEEEEPPSQGRRKAGQGEGDSGSDEGSKGSQKSGGQWSTTPVDKDTDTPKMKQQQKKSRGAGLCKGKPPNDSGSDVPPLPASKTSQEPAKKKKGRGGLCRGAPPADDSSQEEDAAAPGKTSTTSQSPAAKPAAKKRTRSLCGSVGRRRGPPALNFNQWRQWLLASELLPPGFGELALDGGAAAADAGPDRGAGVGKDFADAAVSASKLGESAATGPVAGTQRSGTVNSTSTAIQGLEDLDSDDSDALPGPPREEQRQMAQPLLAR